MERIAGAGKIAAVLTLEGGHQIADDLAVLRMYHRLGVRSMTLTHFRNNTVPAGLEDVSKMPALTTVLLRRGYTEADVRKILGGNLLRVLRAVTGS